MFDGILYTDNQFTKTCIATCTPKKRWYAYTIVVYLLTLYVENVSIIYSYRSLLFHFDNL